MYGNSPEQLNSITNDEQKSFVLAVGGGDNYQGCYVLAVTVDDGGESAELTLLSPNEQAATTTGNADATLAALGAVGISDWAVPTKAQMQLVEAKLLMGSVLLIIFYVENLDVGSWGVKNDV